MATKIRVYELARDLNMKSKALLEKLKDMDISVGSHVSSLDDDTVVRIKANFFGTKPDPSELTRVKPKVIRRRKKRAPGKSAHTGGDSETSPKSQETDSVSGDLSGEAVGRGQRPAPARDSSETEPVVQPSVPLEKTDAGPGGKKDTVRKNEGVSVGKSAPKEGDVSPSRAGSQKASLSKPPGKDASARRSRGDSDPGRSPSRVPAGKQKRPRPSQRRHPAASKPGKQESHALKGIKTDKKKKRKKIKKETPAKIIKLPAEGEERITAPKADRLPKTGGRPAGKKNVSKRSSGYARGKTALPNADNGSKIPQKDAPLKSKKKRRKPSPVVAGRKPEAEVRKPVPADKKSKDIKWTKKKISFKRKEVVEGDALYAGDQRGRKSRKNAKIKAVKAQKTRITTPKAIKRRVKIDETIILSDLAKRMGIKAAEMIKKLMMLGVMATVNQTIDFDTAALVASEFGYEVEKASFEEEAILNVRVDDPGELTGRSPVVTIMGHVDHGKTSLLDVIRKTRITEIEAGGITQHIGAYNVSTESGRITFLDTPGHEAFTAMRARGARVTDLVVLVVAADDGVMPQTVEAINHSKAAEVPIIVAVNKIDKANADPDRVYRELSEHGLVPEDWGGDTIFVRVSAKQSQGIDTLLEMILLQSEVLELKANPDRRAVGYVVEAKLDSGRGPVATVLVQEGTLHAGEPVVCGIHHGKVRAMLNDIGVQVDSAGPSIPVEVLGLSGVPNAGDELVTLEDDKSAKQVSEHRIQKQRSKDLAKTSRLSLEKLFERIEQGEVKDLNLIIKADVHGSIEALGDSLTKLSNDEVTINVIHSATGTITESDVSLAAVSDAIIIGFNVRPTPKVQGFANEEHVDMRFYNVIYNAIKDIQDAILGMMSSTYEERLLGRAEIREVFHVPKVGAIAGCYVTDGKIQRGQLARLLRDGVVSYDGKLGSLRRFKDDVKEVQGGYECGIGIENYNDIKVGDVIECYYLEEIKPEL